MCSYLIKKGKIIFSDHFTQILQCDIKYMKQRPVREEYFDFKSPEGKEKFKHILCTESNLAKCFENGDKVEKQVNDWLAVFNNTCGRSFTNTRVCGKVKVTELSKLQKLRTELVQKKKLSPDDANVRGELEKVDEEITFKVAERNKNKI